MVKKWIFFWICIVLIAGSLVGIWAARDKQAFEQRGVENATQTFDLPYRLPLAGVNVDLLQYSPEELNKQLDQIQAAGFTWVRQTFLWEKIEPERGQLDWDAYDALVEAVSQHDKLRLVAVLDGTPRWARHEQAPDHPFAPPASPADYANFAGQFAAHYGANLTYYQIWDEPNIKTHWGNLDPRPASYVAMLQGAYTAIHTVDPDASVIMAALAPTVETGPDNLSDLLFLQAVYDLGGKSSFDAAAGKPYGFNDGPNDRRVDSKITNFSRLILLREEMVKRGDGDKPLWGSNFGWNHLPDDWSGPPSIWGQVTAEQQEQYTRAAYQRAMMEWPWIGGLILQNWMPDAPADDPVQGFAIAPIIESWHGPLLPQQDTLLPGYYPAQNDYTTYTGNWRFSELGADALALPEGAPGDTDINRITVRFQGTSLAIPVRRDDYLAYLYVTVDGKQANALPRNQQDEAFIILTSTHRKPSLDMIVVAKGLDDSIHTAEIIQHPRNGDDRWPIAGFAVGWERDTKRYDRAIIVSSIVGLLAFVGAIVVGFQLPWRRVRPPSSETLRRSVEWLLSLIASAFVMFGALLTWGDAGSSLLRRDTPALALTVVTAGIAALSPIFVITLAALLILFVLIYNRPLLGIMLIIFWSAFFLTSLDLLHRLFSAVEVYFVLTVLALCLRLAFTWGQTYRREGSSASMLRLLKRPSKLDWAALAWLGISIISLTWVEYWSPAIREFRIIILEPVLFYFVLRLIPLQRRDLLWLADTLLFTGAAIAVVGLYLYFTGKTVVETEEGARRLVSVYGSPNGVGLYLGRCLPFALAFLLLPVSDWRRAYSATAGGLMLLAVLFSQSRGAILLGLPAALLVVLLLWRGRRGVVLMALVIAVIPLALLLLAQVLPRLSNLMGGTTFFRTHLWYSSVQLIRERPLTGVGLDQFLYWYRSRYLLPAAWEEPNLSIPHNILLNYWVNLGIVGVLVGAAFQVLFWRMLWRAHREARQMDPLMWALLLGLGGSMADYLAHGMVDVGYFAINLSFVFFLSIALLQRVVRQMHAPLEDG